MKYQLNHSQRRDRKKTLVNTAFIGLYMLIGLGIGLSLGFSVAIRVFPLPNTTIVYVTRME